MAAGAQSNKASTSPYPGFLPGNQLGFRKGVSGNPGGRSKLLREVERLALEACPDAIAELHRLLLNSPSHRVRVAAAVAILDRGLGRAPVKLIDSQDRPIISEIRNLIVSPDGRVAEVHGSLQASPSSPIDH